MGRFNLDFHKEMTAKRDAGMTLIEIIIVMALIGGLMAVIVGHISDGNRVAKIRETELGFGQLRSSLLMYRTQVGKYPTTEQGLKALVESPTEAKNWRGPYCEPDLIKDAWGEEIRFESDGRKLHFLSAGDDGQFGTPDDIEWPAPEKTAEN